MLSRVRLNHIGAKRLENPLAYALLFTGIAACIVLFLAMQNLNQKNAALVMNINQLQQPDTTNRRSNGTQDTGKPEEITAVKSVMVELSLPWESLFETLESLNIPDVQPVSIEPNPRQGKLRLTAEASDIGSMLLYVERMAMQPVFREVLLLSHEQTVNSMMPIRFVVEAAWKL
ncbi:MAG: hypothetical protein Q8J65_05415 [Nitrosomonadales bacterium]|nr:hypothetical protein [Nitrosomonadales bacterium]